MTVKVEAVEAAVVATNFIARSPSSKEVIKSANLLKSLSVNVLITGDSGVGKLNLAQYILPNTHILTHDMVSQIENYNPNSSAFIIKDFDKIEDLQKFQKWFDASTARVVATSRKEIREDIKDRFFSVFLHLKPLKERHEDVQPLAKLFLKEAQEILGQDSDKEVNPERLLLDLSQNAHSLRRSIFFSYLMDNLGENEIMMMMENYLMKNIGGNNDYRDFLYLYEAPLINASMKKFKSQLQVAERLGLNRNTLRKKIQELKDLV